jgi:hypothetical protein
MDAKNYNWRQWFTLFEVLRLGAFTNPSTVLFHVGESSVVVSPC